MYQKVKAYVEKYHMLEQSDRVITGISGGADSVCLLFVLLKLQEEIGFSLQAVHIHHGIRGKSADEDQSFVENLCQSLGVELCVYTEDVKSYAKENRLTEEEAGRNLRRQRFMERAEATNANKIALAHHQNDNAETLLLNLCRGTGMQGLGGMRPVTGEWIRPLLCVCREEIEAYLKENNILYCIDETNLENKYTRNRLRNQVFPILTDEVNEKAISHMAETMEQLWKVQDYLQNQVNAHMESCVKEQEDGSVFLYQDAFENVPDALKSMVLHQLLCQVAGRRKDIEATHVRILEELLQKQVGRTADLPYGVKAQREYEGICLKQMESVDCCKKETQDLPQDLQQEQEEKPFSMRVLEVSEVGREFPDTPYTKWFDYDIIKNTVQIRHRNPGDYIVINEEGKRQKLKQYFINEKIPSSLRENIWLVADGEEILWIVGYRQSQKYQIHEHTKRILEIEFYGGQEDGGNH